MLLNTGLVHSLLMRRLMASPATVASRLCDWPHSERPRERLLERGPRGLSEGELLALVLGGGHRSQGGAVATGRAVLSRCGGLSGLARCDARELMVIPGIGLARACAIAAAFELGRRGLAARASLGGELRCSEQAFRVIWAQLSGERQEVFMVVALDAKSRLMAMSEVARGSATSVEVHPREVYGPLIRQGAVSTIVAHNHPSGDPEPSGEDLSLTARLVAAGDVVGIPLLDHLVVGGGRYVSLADRGLL